MLKDPAAALLVSGLVSGAAFGQHINGKALAQDGSAVPVTRNERGKAVMAKLWGVDSPGTTALPWGPRSHDWLSPIPQRHEHRPCR